MSAASADSKRGAPVAKDKKTKKKDRKKGAKGGAASLKALAQNPLVADVVAAALVATAAALKDSKRARALASDAGDELAGLAKSGAKSGEALWDMALQIGRRSLEALTAESQPTKQPKAKAKAKAAAPAKQPKAKAAAPAKKSKKAPSRGPGKRRPRR